MPIVETIEEPLVEMRLKVKKSTHSKFTKYQRKLAVKKDDKVTQEQAFEAIIDRLKV